MINIKERIVQEIIRLGKENRRMRVPALVLVALFLVIYHAIRDFFLQFKYHPVRQRILVGILTMSLLAGQIGIVMVFAEADTEVAESVESEDAENGEAVKEGNRLIISFTQLPNDVGGGVFVPVGTTVDELMLPDTLEAVCLVIGMEAEGDPEDKTEGEENIEEEIPEDQEEPTEDEIPEDGDDTEDESSENGEIPGDEFVEEPTEGEGTENEETESDTEQPEGGDTEAEEGQTESNDTNATDDGEPVEDAGQEAEMQVETFTVTMPEYLSENVIEIEVLENTAQPEQEKGQPKEETIIIENITWRSAPEYDGDTAGKYIFTAVLPAGYRLAEGVAMPQITVEVQEDIEDEEVLRVQALIDALPTVEEVKAMDMDGQRAAYDQTQEAYDAYMALTEEQRALITGAEVFEVLFAFFNGQIMPLATVISNDVTWENQTFNTAVTIAEGRVVTITLKGTNIVKSDTCEYAAINVPESSTLIIKGDGELEAYGFNAGSSGGNGSAGIGGGRYGNNNNSYNQFNCGKIIISSGTVYAVGGYGAAGIGMAHYQHDEGSLTIYGGTVTAVGGGGGKGIGRAKTTNSGSGFTVTVDYPGHVAYGSDSDANNYVAIDESNEVNWKNYGWIKIAPSPVTDFEFSGTDKIAVRDNEETDISKLISIESKGEASAEKLLSAGIVYSVSGNKNSNTTIDGNGNLKIGDGETASHIIITAVSKADYNKKTNITAAIEYHPQPIQNLVYTGAAQALVKAGSIEGGTMKYSLDGKTYSTNVPTATAAGDYTIRYKSEGASYAPDTPSERSVTVTIGKATPDVTPPTGRGSLKYTGEAQELVTRGTTTGGTLQYSLNQTSGYSTNIPTGTNAGNYTIYYKVIGDSNYNDVTVKTLSVSIGKATPALNVQAVQGLIYTGESHKLVTGSTMGGTLEYSLNGTDYNESIPTGINAGNYTVYYKVAGDSNYNDVTAKTLSVSIGKATPNVTPPTGNANLKYTGGEQELIEAGTAVGGTLQYSLNQTTDYSTDIPTGTDAGEYKVWYKIDETNNYKGVEPTSVNVTIAKENAEITEPPKPKTLRYNGSPQELVTAGTASFGIVVYSLDKEGEYTESIPEGTNPGNYKVWYKVENTDNYDGVEADFVDVTISKKTTSQSESSTTPSSGDNNSGSFGDGGSSSNMTVASGNEGTKESGNNDQDIGSASGSGSSAVTGRIGSKAGSSESRATTALDKEKTTDSVDDEKDAGSDSRSTDNAEERENMENGDSDRDISVDDNSTVVILPDGENAEPNDDGFVTVPAGSVVRPRNGGPEIIIGEMGAKVDANGNIIVPGGGAVWIGNALITLPEDGGTIIPNTDGTVTLPAGAVVILEDETSFTVMDKGGVFNPADGTLTPIGDSEESQGALWIILLIIIALAAGGCSIFLLGKRRKEKEE